MDSETLQIFQHGLADWALPLSSRQKAQFESYASLLIKWNTERMNLTRLTTPHDIAVHHFLDSLALFQVATVPREAQVLDIGPGAGFPGLPVKILRPDIKLTLMEATAKKLGFCHAVTDALGLKDVEMFHGRAEEIAAGLRQSGYDIATYDIVLSRAVAPLSTLLTWAMPYVTRGGLLVAWKGAKAASEIQGAAETARQMRVEMENIELALPETGVPPVVHSYILCRHAAIRRRG